MHQNTKPKMKIHTQVTERAKTQSEDSDKFQITLEPEQLFKITSITTVIAAAAARTTTITTAAAAMCL